MGLRAAFALGLAEGVGRGFCQGVACPRRFYGGPGLEGRAGETIGPELGFGWVVGDALEEPVLLVKCAWGGKSLAVDFRPPSAGKPPYLLGEKADAALAADPTILGKYYREILAPTEATPQRTRLSLEQ